MNEWTSAEWRLIMRAACNGDLADIEQQQVMVLVREHRGSPSLPATFDWIRGYCDAVLSERIHQLGAAIALAQLKQHKV